jgi:predicted Rossmann-fold nucleotide-binding protein
MEEDDNVLYVGVVGYSAQKFDERDAREILEDALDDIEDEYVESGDYTEIAIVSGLTNMGIPRIAYQVADDRGYKTIGFVPEEANDYESYAVDEIIYSGEFFGDESEAFVDSLDVLIKIGGGDQSQKELEMAEEDGLSVLDFDLESFD